VENIDDSGDINRAWENVRQNIKISAADSLSQYERKQHKLRFDESVKNSYMKGSRLNCSSCRNQAKLMPIM
jgi:hypothetical protein